MVAPLSAQGVVVVPGFQWPIASQGPQDRHQDGIERRPVPAARFPLVGAVGAQARCGADADRPSENSRRYNEACGVSSREGNRTGPARRTERGGACPCSVLERMLVRPRQGRQGPQGGRESRSGAPPQSGDGGRATVFGRLMNDWKRSGPAPCNGGCKGRGRSGAG